MLLLTANIIANDRNDRIKIIYKIVQIHSDAKSIRTEKIFEKKSYLSRK